MWRGARLSARFAGCAALLGAPSACDQGLPEAECLEIRRAAYEVVYRPQTCMEDADCVPSDWPGCPRPLNDAGLAAIASSKARFVSGRCPSDAEASCAPAPEAYCDRNLCVFRRRAGSEAEPP